MAAEDAHSLEELIGLLASLAADVKAAKADGVVDWRDLPEFVDLLPKAWAAMQDLPNVANELALVLHDSELLKGLLKKAVDAMVALSEAVVLKAA